MRLIKHHVQSLIANGAFTAAITIAADFARRNPGNAVVFFLIAQAEEAAGYTKAAIQSVSQSIALAPYDHTYRIMRGRLYLKDNQLVKAIEEINCIISMGKARQDATFLGSAIACRDELLDRVENSQGVCLHQAATGS